MEKFQHVIAQIRTMYGEDRNFIPLHEPLFIGNEKKYLNDCIDSTFVSSVGQYVSEFERRMAEYTGASYAIAVVNGTAALHLSLILAGVQPGDIVISQALSFVATANAIKYTGATPFFIDVDPKNLGMSAEALLKVFDQVEVTAGGSYYKPTGQRISAVVPMHTFGFPADIETLVSLCEQYNIPLIEDAAESLGSTYMDKHTGTFGLLGTYSFNGNKTITCGGGGIIVTDDEELGRKAKHLSTQAKISHAWEFAHDMLGYNYRCPNLNAALACAQLENLEKFIANKRETAHQYADFFLQTPYQFITEPSDSRSNCWLNAILMESREERDAFLKASNEAGVMTRPVWNLLHRMEYLKDALHDDLTNSIFIEDRLVNIPSSVRL
jgi:perosamine synthetase